MKHLLIALLVLVSALSYAQIQELSNEDNTEKTTKEKNVEELSKVRVLLYEAGSERPIAHSHTNEEGHFEFTILEHGHYRLDLSHKDENTKAESGLYISSEHCEHKVGQIILRKEHPDEHMHHQHKDHFVHICRAKQ